MRWVDYSWFVASRDVEWFELMSIFRSIVWLIILYRAEPSRYCFVYWHDGSAISYYDLVCWIRCNGLARFWYKGDSIMLQDRWAEPASRDASNIWHRCVKVGFDSSVGHRLAAITFAQWEGSDPARGEPKAIRISGCFFGWHQYIDASEACTCNIYLMHIKQWEHQNVWTCGWRISTKWFYLHTSGRLLIGIGRLCHQG